MRAMILYPMNALANDQRQRLGNLCKDLHEAGSGFQPTFGQYIGQTPENKGDARRNATAREEERQPGEMIFREEMRNKPPHILLTNYSMLEYLLIRPGRQPAVRCRPGQALAVHRARRGTPVPGCQGHGDGHADPAS